jgi:hypothetical protein
MTRISELIVNDVLEEGRRAGATDCDIGIAQESGVHPYDVRVMREYTGAKGRLLVFRCPNLEHLGLHGRLRPKPMHHAGRAPEDRPARASDYDLMSAWRRAESGWTKIFVSAPEGAKSGNYTEEAREMMVELNGKLISPLQHGAQDDFQNVANRGVLPEDHFVAFCAGRVSYLDRPEDCRRFYSTHSLHWPYDDHGRFMT